MLLANRRSRSRENVMFLVTGIFIANEKGEPMQSVERVSVIAGQGIAGDRYATNDGSFSKSKVGMRDVTMFSQEALDAANQHSATTTPFLPQDTRRNILVAGGPENLCDLKGKSIVIGNVVLEFTEECDPCNRPSKLCDKPGYKEAFNENGRGGIRVKVLEGGEIKVGDKIQILDR